jgi:DNA-directed RNA polymerase specialized sigma24 family protein
MGSAGQTITQANLHEVLTPRIAWLGQWVERRIPPRMRATVSVDDILQEVWIAAYRTVGNFKPYDPDAVARWLTRIADTKLASVLRAARRLKRGGDLRFVCNAAARRASLAGIFSRLGAAGKTPSRDAHGLEVAHMLLIAIASLNDARRHVV